MIGLDTNVLARYIVQDDPEQSAASVRLIESRCTPQSPGWIGVTALVELSWVLSTAYRYEKNVIVSVIRQLLRTTELKVEDSETAWNALREFESGGGEFADYLLSHRNHRNGCARTYAFDRRAARGRHFASVP